LGDVKESFGKTLALITSRSASVNVSGVSSGSLTFFFSASKFCKSEKIKELAERVGYSPGPPPYPSSFSSV
jgi:hypothetical protein